MDEHGDEHEAWECPSCGARPAEGPDNVENDNEDLWGPIGETIAVCPECGAADHFGDGY